MVQTLWISAQDRTSNLGTLTKQRIFSAAGGSWN